MNWVDFGATTLVLLLAGALTFAMFFFIRVASGESENSKMVRDMVETLFGTPAHLRGNNESPSDNSSAGGRTSVGLTPFQEPCPACGAQVTEADAVCPSCELRLL